MMTATTEVTKPVRLRHELKHQISPQEDLVLAGRLRRLFPHDAHAGADGSYRVTSLYFDTPYDAALREKLAAEQPEVVLLLNNAGCGYLGNVGDGPLARQTTMIDLNVRALTAITHLVLPYMKAGAHILNTSSIASFCANAKLNTYSATKAYVSSFTRGLSYELRNRGISATAVCPGPMATEFVTVGGITGNSPEFERLPYCDPQQVALSAMTAARHGHVFYTPTAFYKVYRVAAKLLPHALVVRWAKCGD